MKDNNFMLLDDEDDSRALNSSGNKDIASQKGNKLEERIKLSLFNVFCQLLKDLQLSPWKIYLLISIEFVQFL